MEGESPSLNRALSNCLKLQYINFFGSNFSNFNFENSVYHMMMITQTSCLHKWKFRFAISKSMHEPPCKILTDLSNTREIFIFLGWSLVNWFNQPFFFSEVFSKGIIYISDGILKSLSLLGGMCDLTNTIKPPFLSIISNLYGNR